MIRIKKELKKIIVRDVELVRWGKWLGSWLRTLFGGNKIEPVVVKRPVFKVKKEEKDNIPVKKQWVKQLGTSTDDEGTGVTTDSSGNIYVTGFTKGGLDGNTNYGSDCNFPPCSDIFLVKYNSSGTKQ